ncbi:MAG: GAF domain-containing sensor histidine kinase [Longimicrobiales bacterium]|nr:GAF domain-containing sensor histidine kinase [Longimicrobiales bacterium]
MDLSVPQMALTELAAAYFQAVVSVALALLAIHLHRRYRKSYFRDWAVAWGIYALRMGAIISFLHTGGAVWLYYHQVFTGWTALALLWAALVFAQQLRWEPRFALLLVFPPVWSYLAIYEMDNFMAAALPAVLFLHAATLATGWAFFQYHREAGSRAARVLAAVLVLWALHHLDYPFLRARGIWNPWGYYLDVLFQLGVGAGILLLVQEDLDEGLRALSALSADLQSDRPAEDLPDALIERALELRAVRGSALYWIAAPAGRGRPPPEGRPPLPGAVVAAAGACRDWSGLPPASHLEPLLTDVLLSGEPRVATDLRRDDFPHDYVAALPILQRDHVSGALVVVGEARDPFTALDDSFLVALGQQMGGALLNADLNRRLTERSRELERLQERMVQRHEEERNRISRELHDETAQLLAAVNLRLGLLQERVDGDDAAHLETARSLLGEGIRSIRSVARNLRPVALDDLGLLSALRALARDLSARGGLEVEAHLPAVLPPVPPAAELALYRTVQEGLANVVRHAEARRVRLQVAERPGGGVSVAIDDDGRGYPEEVRTGRLRHSSGLAGMRERIAAVGGEVTLGASTLGGACLRVDLAAQEV